jgi:NTE family protein
MLSLMPTKKDRAAAPLTADPEMAGERLENKVALCLSGGGYRAMLFHLGTLWYLNDAGLLPQLARVSSVSGGSITAAVLGTRWKRLEFEKGIATNFRPLVVKPLRALARRTLDLPSIVLGIMMPGTTINRRVVKRLRQMVYGDATLQDLPDDGKGEGPRFIINATNLQTGALFRFSRPYLADYRVGMLPNPRTSIAAAVAASAAFPPILSPARLKLRHERWTNLNKEAHGHPPFTTRVMLTDGGVYDNLGIETAWKRCKRVLISDGGSHFEPHFKPATNWMMHSMRVTFTIDNQVRSLRKRQVIDAFTSPGDPHSGAYWSITSKPASYELKGGGLPIDPKRASRLAHIPTRLKSLPELTQKRLINLGYAMADIAIRKHFDPKAFEAEEFPYPDAKV